MPKSSVGSIPNYEKHLFYTDNERNKSVPSWFKDCTRQEAESQLLSDTTGNVMLRGSRPQQRGGPWKYAISARTPSTREILHYIVERKPQGFLLAVDKRHNPRPLPCLWDVMRFFLNVAGEDINHVINDSPRDSNQYLDMDRWKIHPTGGYEDDVRPSVADARHDYVNQPDGIPPASLNDGNLPGNRDYINIPRGCKKDRMPEEHENDHSYQNELKYDISSSRPCLATSRNVLSYDSPPPPQPLPSFRVQPGYQDHIAPTAPNYSRPNGYPRRPSNQDSPPTSSHGHRGELSLQDRDGFNRVEIDNQRLRSPSLQPDPQSITNYSTTPPEIAPKKKQRKKTTFCSIG